jgi:hypothetical protein
MKYVLKKDGYEKLCGLIEHFKKLADENEVLAKTTYSDKPYDHIRCKGVVVKCEKTISYLSSIYDKVTKDRSAVFSDKELREMRMFFLDLKVGDPTLLDFMDKAFEKTNAVMVESPLRFHSFEIHNEEERKDPVPRISASDSNTGDEEFSVFNPDAGPSRSATPKW